MEWENILKEIEDKERYFIDLDSIRLDPQKIEFDEMKEDTLEQEYHQESLRQNYGPSRHLILTHRTLSRLGLLYRKTD